MGRQSRPIALLIGEKNNEKQLRRDEPELLFVRITRSANP